MKNGSLMFKELFLVALLISITLLSIVLGGLVFNRTITNMADSFKNEAYQSIDLILNADRDSYQSLDALHSALLFDPDSEFYKGAYDIVMTNINDVNKRMNTIKGLVDSNTDLQQLAHPESKRTIKDDMNEFFPAFEAWIADTNDLMKQYESGKDIEALTERIKINSQLFTDARENMNAVGETLALFPDVVARKNMGSASKQQLVVYIITAIIMAIAVLVILFFIKRLIRRLTAVANRQTKLASALRQASMQLSDAGQQLSSGSNEQAASIEETSASMEETLSMVKQNEENTRQTRNLSEEASDSSAKGALKMSDMNKSMEELKRSSNEISKIIKVIDEIAFQTNILALNAAVEAARAGDAGLGFAVVAEEVRNLAQRSAQAAKDTAGIIERNIELSDKGLNVSRDVNASLEEISLKTKNVNQLMAEIAAASEEQSRGIGQVTEAISQMENVVQQNAATAQESAATAEELFAQAELLENAVLELNDLIKGSKNASIPVENDSRDSQMRRPGNKGFSSLPAKTGMTKPVTRDTKLVKKHIVSPDDLIPLNEDDDF